MRVAHFLVPGRIDQRTGGYLYDARIVEGLRGLGWDVRVHELDGRFPHPDEEAVRSAADALSAVPDGACVVLDGLGFLAFRPILSDHARRLRLVGLVHHLVSEDMGIEGPMDPEVRRAEAEVLSRCAGVIVTSPYTASRLLELGVASELVRTVVPGTRPAALARGPREGDPPALLCVGSVLPRKGQHVLVRALARLRDQAWTCTFAGSLERDTEYAAEVRRLVRAAGIEDRVSFPGECGEEELDRLYDRSSVFVLPSFYEGYGMAVAEALARGLPIVATTGGAIPHTAPADAALLVAPGDGEGMAVGIARLIVNRRFTIKEGTPPVEAAPLHTTHLPDWPHAARAFAQALMELTGRPGSAEVLAGGATPAAERTAHEPERFSAAWLQLREPADQRARSADLPAALSTTLAVHWRESGWRRVLDLGSGTGSNLRFMAPKLSRPQTWTLVDHDADLLARVGDHPMEEVTVYRALGDLSLVGLRLVHATHLVTASALLDLVSEEWLEGLVRACRAADAGALFALTYDGRIEWSPSADPDDELVRDAVNSHQRRDKGLGPALGPLATEAAARLFRTAGFEVSTAPSPWRLGPEDASLTLALIDGWAAAAEEERPADAARIREWAARRRDDVRGGRASVEVGHLDVLALP